MPEELDDAYNEPLQEAYASLQDPEGPRGETLSRLRTLQGDYLEYITQADSVSETERRFREGAEELIRSAEEEVGRGKQKAQDRAVEGHAEGYAAAAALTDVDVPEWDPSEEDLGDLYGQTTFDPPDNKTFVRATVEKSVSYMKQDLKWVRKYVSEERYAEAVANVLASGDEEIIEEMRQRGIDLTDWDKDDFLDEAKDAFEGISKRIGDPTIRGVLKDIDIDELAQRSPELARRVRRVGTDQLGRVLDEAAKSLAANSPAAQAASWVLSTRHQAPDECDIYASADPVGDGPGIWPVEMVPSRPHPNCLCSIRVRTIDPEEGWSSNNEIDTPAPPDMEEDAIRAVLEDVAKRMDSSRSITDRHVERVKQRVEAGMEAVQDNPRGNN